MKIKLLATLFTSKTIHKPGEILAIEDETATKLIQSKLAVEDLEKAKEKATSTAQKATKAVSK